MEYQNKKELTFPFPDIARHVTIFCVKQEGKVRMEKN